MPTLSPDLLIQRIDHIPLYLHAYAFHLNMRCGQIVPEQLLDIAHQQRLAGLKIHVADGEDKSLANAAPEALSWFGQKARDYALDIHIETSASAPDDIDQAVRIALATGATAVRFYPRYEGYLQDVLTRVANDIGYMKAQYGHTGLRFTIEQHEDLKGRELVQLVRDSQWRQLSILFDFANMINADEEPLSALADMAPYITDVHIKDARLIREAAGNGHLACKSGEGDLPVKEMLKRLLCLGEEKAQVVAFGLEEEVDYYAPPFRTTNEGNNPWIPWREMSETPLPTEAREERLRQEMTDAMAQIRFVRAVLADIRQEAAQGY